MKDKAWVSEEFHPEGNGVVLTASYNGVLCNWGLLERRLNPVQARTLAAELSRAADEAEKRGAKDWMT